MNNRKLGRGLEGIFGEGLEDAIRDIEEGASKNGVVTDIEVNAIRPNPFQPRKSFDNTKIQELSKSILEYGVFTPIIVRRATKGYELIAGERRTRATKLAGLLTIPAIVVDYDQSKMMEVALIENIQREQLNPIDEAVAFQKILAANSFTQEELASRVGKSRSFISNSLRILELNDYIKSKVIDGTLSMGHVKPLLTLSEQSAQMVVEHILENDWTVRKVEEFVKEVKGRPANKEVVKSIKQEKSNAIKNLESQMSEKLGTKVLVESKTIKIKFSSNKDLNRILDILNIEID